jgi:hypothetical protein
MQVSLPAGQPPPSGVPLPPPLEQETTAAAATTQVIKRKAGREASRVIDSTVSEERAFDK